MKMKEIVKRSLSLAMALCMTVSASSFSVLAKQGPLEKVVNVVKASSEYQLTNKWIQHNPVENALEIQGEDKLTFHSRPGELGMITDAKNVLLYDMPEGDFTATVKVTNTRLTSDYQAIGLAAFASTSRVAGTMRRYHSGLGGNVFAKMNFNGDYDEKAAQDTEKAAPAWLKLERQGNKFIHSYSYDGENFTVIGETTNNQDLFACKDLKIAIYTGGAQTFDAVMENFTIDGEKIPFAKEREPVEIIDIADFEDIYANYGTLLEELNLPESVEVTLEDGTTKELAVNWDSDTYKPEEAGVQTVRGTVELGEYIVNSADLKAEVKVHVMEEGQEIPVTKIVLNRTEILIAVDSAIELKAETFPLNAANKAVMWESDNTEVAVVDAAAGKVKAVGKGTAVITARAGEAEAACIVEVTDEVAIGTMWGVDSPDGNVQMTLQMGENFGLTYEAAKGGKAFIEKASVLGLKNTTIDTSKELTYVSAEKEVIDEIYKTYSGKFSEHQNRANQLKVTFKDSTDQYLYSVIARVYDDGVAFGYELAAADGNDAATVQISDEMSTVNVPDGATTWSFEYGGAYEKNFEEKAMKDLSGAPAIPVLYQTDDTYVLFNEANLIPSGFCGARFKTSTGNNTFNLDFAGEQRGAVTVDLPFTSPWRYAVVGDLRTITENTMAENLSPNPDEETYHYSEWVEPGIASWTWLAEGETRDGQSNVDAVLRYIDMAAELGWKYFLWDDGWQSNPANNVMHPRTQEVIDYAAEKGIGILVWVDEDYIDTDSEREERFKIWSEMGIKGIKADFFDGEHQTEVEEYKDIYEDLAKYKMVGIMHGCNKPTGETRTYPHILTREGIRGDEFVNRTQTVQRQLTILPFIRGAVGPADYTPIFDLPNKNTGEPLGNTDKTVGSQLTIPVLLESGIPCMADKDSTYLREDIRGFYDHLPATWDETRFINGEVGEYVTMARRNGDTWYIAANTDETARTEYVDFADYLEEGVNYKAQIWYDGPDDSSKTDIVTERRIVTATDSVELNVARKGGSVIKLTKLADTEDPDKVWLAELVKNAKNAFSESDYTAQQWAPFYKALIKAQVVLDQDHAATEEIDHADKELRKAMTDLSASGEKESARDLPIDGMKATAGSEETVKEDNKVENALDNNTGTFWHTSWSGVAMQDAWIDIALPEATTVGGVRVLSRPGGGNGTINLAEVWVKTTDSEDYVKVVDQASMGQGWHTVTFDEIENVTNVKIQPLETQGGNKYASAAEIRIMGAEKEVEAPVVDKTDLQEAVDAAQALNQADYTDESWAVLEAKLAAAETVLANAEATDYDVLLAAANLEYAMEVLVAAGEVDKEDLAALIEYAKEAKEDPSYKYVVAKVREMFEKALSDAIETNDKENAVQVEVDAAYDALLKAVHLLEFKGNMERLESLVVTARRETKEKYTPNSWATFAEALQEAETILAEGNTLQAEVDAARTKLLNAIFGLREVPNKDKLDELLGKVKAMDLSVYSDKTANAVKAAYAKAMAVFEDENADQKEVDAAVAALEEAVAAAKAENGEEDGSQKDHKVVSDDAGSKDTTNKTTSKTAGNTAAKTGDNANATIPMAAGLVGIFMTVVAWKKRTNRV